MESLFILTAVAGATELLRRLYAKDYIGAITIAVAAGIGGLAAGLNVVDVAVAEGIIAGLGASGLVTVASRVGGTSSPR